MVEKWLDRYRQIRPCTSLSDGEEDEDEEDEWKETHLKEQKDQYHLRYEMFPKLVWYSKQNIQHGVSHTLQDLLPSIFLLNTHWR